MNWGDEFHYTDRNPVTTMGMNELYRKRLRVSRAEMNSVFLQSIPKQARILEVGCNVGTQLRILHGMGYRNLEGCDINPDNIRRGMSMCPPLQMKVNHGTELPYPDESFDLVFTSGVLIHQDPETQLKPLMDEIVRITKRWVWGYEYYAPTIERIESYETGCWKGPYIDFYRERGLKSIVDGIFIYRGGDEQDAMFLLEK